MQPTAEHTSITAKRFASEFVSAVSSFIEFAEASIEGRDSEAEGAREKLRVAGFDVSFSGKTPSASEVAG